MASFPSLKFFIRFKNEKRKSVLELERAPRLNHLSEDEIKVKSNRRNSISNFMQVLQPWKPLPIMKRSYNSYYNSETSHSIATVVGSKHPSISPIYSIDPLLNFLPLIESPIDRAPSPVPIPIPTQPTHISPVIESPSTISNDSPLTDIPIPPSKSPLRLRVIEISSQRTGSYANDVTNQTQGLSGEDFTRSRALSGDPELSRLLASRRNSTASRRGGVLGYRVEENRRQSYGGPMKGEIGLGSGIGLGLGKVPLQPRVSETRASLLEIKLSPPQISYRHSISAMGTATFLKTNPVDSRIHALAGHSQTLRSSKQRLLLLRIPSFRNSPPDSSMVTRPTISVGTQTSTSFSNWKDKELPKLDFPSMKKFDEYAWTRTTHTNLPHFTQEYWKSGEEDLGPDDHPIQVSPSIYSVVSRRPSIRIDFTEDSNFKLQSAFSSHTNTPHLDNNSPRFDNDSNSNSPILVHQTRMPPSPPPSPPSPELSTLPVPIISYSLLSNFSSEEDDDIDPKFEENLEETSLQPENYLKSRRVSAIIIGSQQRESRRLSGRWFLDSDAKIISKERIVGYSMED